MKLLHRAGLGGRLLAIILFVVSLDVIVNSLMFESARVYATREDDAAWMAEHLIVAHRVIDASTPAQRPAVAREMSTERFEISWSQSRTPARNAMELPTLHQQMLGAQPGLRDAQLRLKLLPLSAGGNFSGSTRLRDGSIINFRIYGHAPLSLNFGRFLSMAVPSMVLVLLAWIMFRMMLHPLRSLVKATSEVGTADPRPLPENGEGEVLHLIRAFNAMQQRIHQLLDSGSQTLLAITHDLRTPLARLQLRIDHAGMDPQLRHGIAQDIDEMRDLLVSLQTYVESGRDNAPLERIDIAVTAQTLINNVRDSGGKASYKGPPHLEIFTRPVAIRRALSNLVENGLAYAGHARLSIAEHSDAVEIVVEDDGPGIPEDRLADVLHPFVRLDNARTRNTKGMGLGLPIVDSVVKAEGGQLLLANKPGGGLRVTIRLSRTPG
ncbi:MAG: ATP-binding protein [Novosphingobium sp.]